MSRIELRRLQKRYGPVGVLADIDLTIEPGEFCVLLGPSGCGKSTLLRLIAGLDDPSEGDILIGGQRVNDLPPSNRDIGMVFQSYALYPHMTVYENMAFGLRHRAIAKDEIHQRVHRTAGALRLGELLGRKPAALSGGQRQRVAIGRAMVRQPRVFLFDEPLSNLDAALRVNTRVEIAKLHRDLANTSMVYVTHDQVEAMTLATQIVLLRPLSAQHPGLSIAQYGTPLELYHRPANLFVAGFIGSPSMNFFPATLVSSSGQGALLRVSDAGAEAGADTASNGAAKTALAARAQPPREVAAAVRAGALAGGSAVTVGIRPEHLLVGAGPFQGVVSHVEQLGERAHVYLHTGLCEPPLIGTVSMTSTRVGDTLAFDLPADALHIFDARGHALPRIDPT